VHYGQSDYSQVVQASSDYFTTEADPPYAAYYVHQADLSGLTSDTAYQYQIFTNDVNLTPGGGATTRTAKPPTASSFRFVAFGDTGYGNSAQENVGTRLAQVQPDLVVHTGDIIYQVASYDLFEERFFQTYADLLKSIWIAPSGIQQW
jgi:phosphodiesterase/alkaline phosphatase D-like protein